MESSFAVHADTREVTYISEPVGRHADLGDGHRGSVLALQADPHREVEGNRARRRGDEGVVGVAGVQGNAERDDLPVLDADVAVVSLEARLGVRDGRDSKAALAERLEGGSDVPLLAAVSRVVEHELAEQKSGIAARRNRVGAGALRNGGGRNRGSTELVGTRLGSRWTRARRASEQTK